MDETGDLPSGGDPLNFASLQPALRFNRRARPPPMNLPSEDTEKSRVALRQPQIQKKESKGGLRAMFTRNKSEKAEKPQASSVMDENGPASELPDRKSVATSEISLHHRICAEIEIVPGGDASDIPAIPTKPARRASRINLRSRSIKQGEPTTKSPKSTQTITAPTSKALPRASAAWTPPPLFQAYPQAIKHAQLSASTLSADSILKIGNHRRNSSARDKFAQTTQEEGNEQVTFKKANKQSVKHRRQTSGSISKAEWTQKIYVLVTSGYLLQYAGRGPFDRLPEKVLQLGKDSVAFASDVLPGKHWVLQVSQAMGADGTPSVGKGSLFSRLSFRGVDYKRTATSFLLVLECAAEMESWLLILRREVEALGGKQHVSETGKPIAEKASIQSELHSIHRYHVQENLAQNPASVLPQAPSFTLPQWTKENDHEPHRNVDDDASHCDRRNSIIRPSTSSLTNSVISHDGQQLENLRDNQNRLSYMSSGQRTLVTSQSSSPMVSPHRDVFDEFPPKHTAEDARLRPNAASTSERRRSMQTTYTPIIEDSENYLKKHRHSIHGGTRLIRSRSPAPNFSVPISSNKRYSTMKNHSIGNTSPVSGVSSTRLRQLSLKESREVAPTSTTLTRSLTPVKDSNSPEPQNLQTTNRGSKNASDDIYSHSVSNLDTTPSLMDRDIQRSSTAPDEVAVVIAQLDFQFPQEIASMLHTKHNDFTSLPTVTPRAALPLPPTETAHSQNLDIKVDSGSKEDTESSPKLLSDLPASVETRFESARPGSLTLAALTLSANVSSPISQRPHSARTKATSVSSASFHVLQRVQESEPKALGSRRSMPLLMNGPPPAPPPNYALPPLPSIKTT